MKKYLLLAYAMLLTLVLACGDDIAPIAGFTPTPAASTQEPRATAADPSPTMAPTPEQPPAGHVVEVDKRESDLPVSQTSEGVTITVDRIAVADYLEFYEASDSNARRALDSWVEDEPRTIGQIEIVVENTTGERVSVYPDQGTVVVGNEQVDVNLFLSDDVGGEYFPGVLKEGRVFFFLQRTPYTEITLVLYSVNRPWGSSFNLNAEDFEFVIPVQ